MLILSLALVVSMQKKAPDIRPLLSVPLIRFASSVPTCSPLNSSLPPTLRTSVAAAATLMLTGVHCAGSALYSEAAFLNCRVPRRTDVGPV